MKPESAERVKGDIRRRMGRRIEKTFYKRSFWPPAFATRTTSTTPIKRRAGTRRRLGDRQVMTLPFLYLTVFCTRASPGTSDCGGLHQSVRTRQPPLTAVKDYLTYTVKY